MGPKVGEVMQRSRATHPEKLAKVIPCQLLAPLLPPNIAVLFAP